MKIKNPICWSRASFLTLICLLLSISCGQGRGPKNLSASTYAAIRKAVEALEIASESRDASGSLFDQKVQAATQAADEAFNQMGNQSNDGYAVSQVRSCIAELKQYRLNLDSRDSVSRPIQEQLKGLKGAQIKDSSDVVSRSSSDLDACIKAAKSYL